MRRSLESFIVALLCLTLGIDSAKACWLWRHRCHPAVSRHEACPPAALPQACVISVSEGDWVGVPTGGTSPAACCEHAPAGATIPGAVENAIATDDCCRQVECCPGAEASVDIVAEPSAVAVTESIVAETAAAAAPVGDTAGVVVHGPTVVVDSAAASPTAAAQPLLPVLEPAPTSVVKAASGEQPAAEPAAAPAVDTPAEKIAEPLAMPTPPPAAAEPAADAAVAPAPAASLAVAPPPRPNLFDLYTAEDEPAPAVRTEADAAPAEPAAAPAAEPAQPESEEPAEPAEEEASPESSAEAAADATARTVPDEPQRHWIDASGAHKAQGWLVAVDAKTARILKTNGRYATVALDRLSAADRDYIADVTARLAARPTTPGSGETAGL